MQYSIAALAAFAAVALANPMPQGVTAAITPTGSAPASCTGTVDGSFEITVVKPSVAKRDVQKVCSHTKLSGRIALIRFQRADCGGEGTLVLNLNNGVLLDSKGRTGYIADNFQFQFDKPAQTGAIFTAGFSVCGNSSIALGDTTVFYQCLSGNFYNLYNTNWAPQCTPVALDVIPCGGTTIPSGVTSAPSLASTPVVTASSDGQPEPTTAVTQITDGQPQGPSAIPISQLSDGQPQMPTALVSQLGDGQPQATSAAPVATSSAAAVSQIGDGQPQAGNATSIAVSTPTIAPFQGGANTIVASFGAIAVGLAALAML